MYIHIYFTLVSTYKSGCSCIQIFCRYTCVSSLGFVAGCCSVLQSVAGCCSVLQSVAGCCSVLQGVVVCCSLLQGVVVCCSLLQGVVVCCSLLQGVPVCCGVLQLEVALNPHTDAHTHVYLNTHSATNCLCPMGWLWSVGSIKL